MSTILSLTLQLLLLLETGFSLIKHRDIQSEFLQFSSAATDEFRSSTISGSYEVLILRKKYTRIEKVRFNRGEFAVEMFDDMAVFSEQDCVDWQENTKLLDVLKPKLIGATGETSGYRYSLEFQEYRRDQSKISQMELISGDNRENLFVPSIYEPYTIGNCGFAVDAVKNGVIQLTEWYYDKAKKLWFGKFKEQSSKFEHAVYFDPVHHGIVKSTLFINQTAVSTKEIEYNDKLRTIRIYRHTSLDSVELLETRHFGRITNEEIDPMTFRISNFGHKEPFLLKPSESPVFSIIWWSILPIIGIAILWLSRRMITSKEA